MATVVVQKPASATVTVSEVNNSVVLTQPADSRIVEIASAGPAGPPHGKKCGNRRCDVAVCMRAPAGAAWVV